MENKRERPKQNRKKQYGKIAREKRFIMGNQIQKCRTENGKLRIKNYPPG